MERHSFESKPSIFQYGGCVNSFGEDVLENMRQSLKSQPHTQLSKTDIRSDIEDWSKDRIQRESLIQTGYSHRPIAKMTERRLLEALYVNIVHRTKKIERHKAEAQLNKKLKNLFKEKLQEQGIDCEKLKESADPSDYNGNLSSEYEDVRELKRGVQSLSSLDDIKELEQEINKRKEEVR